MVAGGAMSTDSGTNHSFARKLASSDKSTREKAVALLVLWLRCPQKIGEEELKKIWKGLFYCVWHADKAPVQAELIETLAGLLESVEVDLSLSFFKVFLSTMRREWGGIDRLRMDKFYLLLRKFLSHMFKVLDNGGWDQDLVTKFMDALEERAFLARDRFPALGVNLHFADIYWDEFQKFLPVPEGTLGLLLEPFYSILSTSSDKALLKRVRENIFNPLLDDARTLVNNIERKQSPDGTAGRIGCLLNSTSVAPRLFDLASSPSTAQANRKVLYELNDEFSKVAKSFDSFKGTAFQMNGRGATFPNEIAAENTDILIGTQPEDIDGGSRSRSKKKRARAVAPGVKMSLQLVEGLKVKKPKKVKEQSPVNGGGQEIDQNEPVGNGDHLNSEADGKDENEGQAMITKRKRSSKAFIIARTDLPLQKKSLKRKEKKRKKVQPKMVRVDSLDGEAEAPHEPDSNLSERELGTNGHLDNGAQALVVGSICTQNGHQAINEVTMNLERKFDFVAADELVDSFGISTSVSTTIFGSSLETRSKKKRKREKAAGQGASQLPGIPNGAANAAVLQSQAKTGVDEQIPGESVKKAAKKVRFALRQNLICKPHAPLPPLSVRTPPSATPRGSALKSGVLPGPIRTRPIRIVRGTGLGKSRKRASRQKLTMSMQKSKSSTRKLRSRPKL